MGTIQKIKLGINGFGRVGRLVANENRVGVFGVKSSEEIPLAKTVTEFAVGSNRVINGNENSTAQSKVINGSNTLYSFAEIRRTVHGPPIKGARIGRVATFCAIPSTTEDTKIVESVQLGLNGDEIKKDENPTEFNPKSGPTKPTISLFPFSGSDLFYLRDGAGLYNNLFIEDARENYVGQLRKKCFNLMGRSEKVMELVEKCIAQNGPGALTKEIEMMIELILRSNKVPYGFNSYLNEVKKMRSLVSSSTNTKTSVESVKLRSVYQSASMIAQDICAQLRSKTQFRVIFGKIIREIPMEMKNGVEGIRVTISGRINGAEIARTECGKYGKTSRTTISQKVDYACAEALTRSGLIGVKVWISYRKNRTGRSSPSVEV